MTSQSREAPGGPEEFPEGTPLQDDREPLSGPYRGPGGVPEEAPEPRCWSCGGSLDHVADDEQILGDLGPIQKEEVVLRMCGNLHCGGGAHLHIPKGRGALDLMVNALIGQELVDALSRSVIRMLEEREGR